MTDRIQRIIEDVVTEVLKEVQSGSVAPPARLIAIGSDHAGFQLKRSLIRFLTEELEMEPLDCGTFSEESVDYPDIAEKVARSVSEGRCPRGIMIDGAGVGSTMVCNRIPGVLAAPGFDLFTVRNSREHNDANLLVLGSNVVSSGEARRLVRV
ncbi:MAG: RpiB/LacA/LacB family sugar-phosphate isomerase, partial [Candidatus Eisenbacteria bacterium]|nr:RpiB/LacA/LacB family sugar-phosphate isomerase [Candidatus Eisenbacteria bacterium]